MPKITHISFLLLAVFIVGSIKQSTGQNIFDGSSSMRFASYLYHTGQYELAAEELERSVFFFPESDSLRYALIRTYLKAKQFEKSKDRFDSYFPEKNKLSPVFSKDYCRLLITTGQQDQAKIFLLSDNNITDIDRQQLNFEMQMLDYKWETARNTYLRLNEVTPEFNNAYQDIFTRIDNARFKKPGLALAMSAIIPGAGKAYTGNWKDGLFSLVFVGGTAFQAIRYYNKKGPASGYFIAYSSIAASFYIGNLYGSYKAARKHNMRIKNSIRESIRNIIDNSY